MNVLHVLETSIYAHDLQSAERFYRTVVGLEFFARAEERHVFFRCGDAMLLVFNPERTRLADASVPPHGATGPGHVAFAIAERDIEAWRDRLRQHGVEIEAEVDWPRGGHSIYFRDPAGNSIELATPSVWGR